ncbi:glucose 1-dehydrogenase [Orbaceae bacterium ESL0727]|nr:glucose 1-dehydrogenase [Orbaceae bacterium ESL0727]
MSRLFNLKNKVAIVTGASSGLGVQFAKALAKEGANVVVLARRIEKLNQVKQEIESQGVTCLALHCDVNNNDEIKSVVKTVVDQLGRIDILVNNAGTAIDIPAESITDEEWRHVIDTNLNSLYFMAREVGQVMLKQHYGKIINIGSIHSTVAMKPSYLSAYCTSKGGVLMLTKSLAVEWAKKGITVNAIGPAYFPSEMTAETMSSNDFEHIIDTYCPMGRTGRAGELDGALIYFASDASSYTTGQLLTVDGGWTAI